MGFDNYKNFSNVGFSRPCRLQIGSLHIFVILAPVIALMPGTTVRSSSMFEYSVFLLEATRYNFVSR